MQSHLQKIDEYIQNHNKKRNAIEIQKGHHEKRISFIMELIYKHYCTCDEKQRSPGLSQLLLLEKDPTRTKNENSYFRQQQAMAGLYEWAMDLKNSKIQEYVEDIQLQNKHLQALKATKIQSYQDETKYLNGAIHFLDKKIEMAKDNKIIHASFNQLIRINAEIDSQKKNSISDKKHFKKLLEYKKELENKTEAYKKGWAQYERKKIELEKMVGTLKQELRSLGANTSTDFRAVFDDYKILAEQKKESLPFENRILKLNNELTDKILLVEDLKKELSETQKNETEKRELSELISSENIKINLLNLNIQLAQLEIKLVKLSSTDAKSFFNEEKALIEKKSELMEKISKISKEQHVQKPTQNK